ncbi:Si-specific NAD(P)(+) transhydrogenase [Thiorhodovibrio frisius]|uniref:Soluble pyridine nucleotide transhydrogenase n=1 Tax=Thiorhodovibrio frisius TaxID=631362 RepID=H8Z543_9GAMM|nr:Si-specific NAD(P)(+) transhydrogenase [Thiorhodovibrio frisius]EIC20450.1 pyruvate/2-oxoglutarate dehydrogenase complex, dihydrolipoamide dehydrogenase component [Thiorhodovibrio frisius]WPL21194.1 Soluble pyridine nucleotide transhydrogenase [Thiorhodovibrio frisius]
MNQVQLEHRPVSSDKQFNTIIIGAGPAGEGAAMKLTKAGQQVAVVDALPRVGGGCTHWGTIPSKALRHSIQMLADYRRNPLFAHSSGLIDIDFPQLLQAADAVIEDQVRTRNRYYQRNRVEIISGEASFLDPHRIAVRRPDGAIDQLSAESFVIATGSRPYHQPDVDFSNPRVLDSDSILQLKHTPRSVTIYGAGVIGCEYASIMGYLDVKVNLVNTRDRLLSFLDDEITDALGYHLREQGVVIRHDESCDRVEPDGDGVVLHCHSGKKLKTEVLLWANGRTGNTDRLGLEAIGLTPNARGQLEVNESYQTALPHIYAAGDVVGPPALASASYDQGRFVGAHIADGRCDWSLIDEFPTGIYTVPEISSVGRTERELTNAQVPYEVGQASFKSIARAQITGHTVGMLKLLFHRETLEILGIHCFGEQASEIVHIGQAIMSQPGPANNIQYFTETTFNYPTMAEAYRVAALNGLNRLF